MFKFIFLGVFLFKEILEYILMKININYSISEKAKIPEELKEHINEEENKKIKAYLKDKSFLSNISNLIDIAFTLFFILLLFPKMETFVININENIIVQGIIFYGIFLGISYILNLSFLLIKTFKIEEKYGFNKTTFKIFLSDLLKTIILLIIIGIPLISGTFYLILNLNNWWIYLFVAIIIFQFLAILIYPKFIMPLFNKFTLLEDDELKEDLIKISNESGFDVKKIFVMDASKRTKHSNAFFTGIGKSKKIVLFDTLLENHNKDEIKAIFAHEAGHYYYKHIKKTLFLSTFSMAAIILTLFLLMESSLLNNAFNIDSIYTKLIYSIIFISSIFNFFEYISNHFSRKNEFQADNYSKKYVESKHLINALIKLHKSNLSNLTPHPLYSKLHYSHPPLIERIKNLKSKGGE